MKKIIYCVVLMISGCLFLSAQNGKRVRVNFNLDWKFTIDSSNNYNALTANENSWRTLNLPHDWSIELPFDSTSPTGTGGGALRGGTGWYTKEFTVPITDSGKNISIHFEGVYCRSTVWLNGHKLGYRPNGYISFHYLLNQYLFYNKKNIIVVKVDNNEQPNSRWYSGSGIYRDVWLQKTSAIAVAQDGTFVTVKEVTGSGATIKVDTKITGHAVWTVNAVLYKIYDASGNIVAREKKWWINQEPNPWKKPVDSVKYRKYLEGWNKDLNTTGFLSVENPHLWSIDSPYLYKLVTQVLDGEKVIDETETTFGIRTFTFDANKGFFLNGKPVKINGVCNHHDLGCLGTAFNYRAAKRQLEILKAMGCNGIRTSHNPPAPGLLDLCDKMGFIVMDEAFDMWKKQKNPYDYHVDWDEWHKKDLQDLVLRDRNHPSVFIWSIGNEIPEQWDSSGKIIAKELADIIHQLDSTRPITSALNNPQPNNNIYQSGALDLVGFNYHHQNFASFQKDFPNQKFIGAETVSALATRGHYDLIPSDSLRRWPVRWDLPFNDGNKDFTVSAYDNVSTPWGSTHEETWKQIKKYPFLSGQYIWTGFDYIGEPTPYPWPARSSYFGIIDLAGFPKDVYYMYQSEWTNKNVLHILPHWNWKQGDTVDVWAYYNNADEVELYLNGKSVSIKKKEGDELHVKWRLPFAPGTLKAISRKNGKVVLTKEVNTAGPAYKIEMTADRKIVSADGEDLSFVTVKVLDKNGNLLPDADNLIQFKVTGEGSITAVDNGNQTSMESFKDNKRKAFNGLCLAVIRPGFKKGSIVLTASSIGLQSAQIDIIVN